MNDYHIILNRKFDFFKVVVKILCTQFFSICKKFNDASSFLLKFLPLIGNSQKAQTRMFERTVPVCKHPRKRRVLSHHLCLVYLA